MKGLHNIRSQSRQRPARRVGRGNASGRGTYSGRGIKGQRSRSGGKRGLTARSMKSYLLRIPKVRGFSTGREGYFTIHLETLAHTFTDGDQVTLRRMRTEGIIRGGQPVKVLTQGTIAKKLTVEAHAFSKSARAAIERAGGRCIIAMRTRQPVRSSSPD